MIYKSPSNIALIKYMGKKDHKNNTPINPSLSYTLENFVSGVRLSLIKEKKDRWAPLEGKSWLPLSMSFKEKKKFLDFFKQLKNIFNLQGSYLIESANNFPKSAGLASSASSFSALTLAGYNLALKKSSKKDKLKLFTSCDLSRVSRRGSGSSCRSFFKPWCLWSGRKIQSVSLPFSNLDHEVIYLSRKEKKVSSSTAHKRIETSPFFLGRAKRAKSRLKKLMSALEEKNWKTVYYLVKDEFEDTHRLFETSKPGFSYRSEKTKQTLREIEKFWTDHRDGPLVTMDAGPHIHLLYRPDQKQLKKQLSQKLKQKIVKGC